jgi:hypothetical protein
MIIISTPFTGLGKLDGFRGNDWFKRRIEIFHKYTLQSLLNQTEQDFTIWLSFRPEEESNSLIRTFDIPHKHIFTFGGIPIWDDKKTNEKEWLQERLKKTLPELERIVGSSGVKMVNLGSDDMYSKEVMASIKAQSFEEGTALTHRLGYVYSDVTDQLAEWNPTTHPPFHTIMYSNETFLNPEKHFNFIKGYKSHELIPKIFKEVRMPDRRYCVVVHDKNISTIFNHPIRGAEIWDEETKSKIMSNFI